jgi:hypothetical protein
MSSQDDFTDWINDAEYYLERAEQASDLLNRGARGVSDAVAQAGLEDIFSGRVEGSSINAQAYREEHKEEEPQIQERVRRQDPRRRLFGDRLTLENMRRIRDTAMDVYNSNAQPSMDIFDANTPITAIIDGISQLNRMAGGDNESQQAGILDEIINRVMEPSLSDDLEWLSDFGSEFGDADLNGDGVVDQVEMNVAVNNDVDENNILRSIHPLMLKLLATNMSIADSVKSSKRQIPKETLKLEDSGKRSNQVSLVQQGFARFDTDENLYNVKH